MLPGRAMEPIANETWKSFMRSYYRPRLLLLLSSLGEAYVGQLARMLRIPPRRVLALLEGDPAQGYSVELALVTLGLAASKPTTGRGRAYGITTKGQRKARSMSASVARRTQRRAEMPGGPPRAQVVARAAQTGTLRWSVSVTGDRSADAWAYDG